MLRGKKNEPCKKPGSGVSHSRGSGSRNQFSTKAPKGNTLQIPSKIHITRTTKSPTVNLKKPLDISINGPPKLTSIPPHSALKKPEHEVKSIRAEASSSLKKSLSNNDSNTSPSQQEEVPVQKSAPKRHQAHKRHFLSSEQECSSHSPVKGVSEGERRKKAIIGPKALNGTYRTSANIKTTNGSPQSKDPEPWQDFLYSMVYNH